jgi:hypothetical protein
VARAPGQRDDGLLRCGRCERLLGVRTEGGGVFTVRAPAGPGAAMGAGAIGAVWAIPCERAFANGLVCQGGWVDPAHVLTLRAAVAAVPELGRTFAGALADLEKRSAPRPDPLRAAEEALAWAS